ncbi:MAG: LarC family nickel insertion protein [Eubacteriales bacterium]
MRTLYFDCSMGAAGDMLMSSLYELIDDKKEFIDEINGLGIPGVMVVPNKSVKSGIVGTHISVVINGTKEESIDVEHNAKHGHNHLHSHGHNHDSIHAHHHNGMHDIQKFIKSLALSHCVSENALAVYHLIAESESYVHNKPIEHIHFHEVGTIDAVTDVIGVCLLIEKLAPDKIIASPIHVGSGHVHCAHGILPVPAPATAYILKGVPIYNSTIQGELCTPTGAALLKHFITKFGEMPVISIEKIGYGMGTKDFENTNCVRAFIGETNEVMRKSPSCTAI